MSAGNDIGHLERDPEDVACDLEDRAMSIARRTGNYDLAGLMNEAAAWLRRLDEERSR